MHLSELQGRTVRLEPLAARHSQDLWTAIGAPSNDTLWTYIPVGPFADAAAFDGFIAEKCATADARWLAVINSETGLATGILALMRIDPPNRVIEVGGVIFSPSIQRSTASTEAQYLLARHVFESLGFRRYEWKCNNRNAPSKRAAARLGFAFEGVFRQHMIVKNRNRDTAWFSMLDTEWPARKAAFETWLDARNFDVLGRQKAALSALNARHQP